MTKTVAASKRHYGENQRPESTMKHDGGIFERMAFDAPDKSFYTELVTMRSLLLPGTAGIAKRGGCWSRPARESDLDEISSETEGESEDESDQHDEAQPCQAQAVAQDLWP